LEEQVTSILRMQETRMEEHFMPVTFWFHGSFYLHPEAGGYMFFRNTSWVSMYYTAVYPRRQNSS
jgi:hypothetical protein